MAYRKRKSSIQLSEYKLKSQKIPKSYNGFTIIHISDLHDEVFGFNQQLLAEVIIEQSPDIIVITGDLIDRRRIDFDKSMDFIKHAVRIAPVYYVTGNHEIKIKDYDRLMKLLYNDGVINISNKNIEIINKKGDIINLVGLDDRSLCDDTLSEIAGRINSDYYTILLAHQPEYIDRYSKFDIDAVFCGHAHGGQVRLPLIGGLYAPNQGIFPKYTCGVYHVNNTSLIVSRGLGNSLFPIRIFNKPNVVKVVLKADTL